ncbi:MAG TPA: hypothetical protein VIP28_13085 [Nocardioides sp.]
MATKPNQTAVNEQAGGEQATPPAEQATPAETTAASTATASATPDEFGRLRVRDRDTGHERTIHAGELPHGNYTVLDRRASDRSGDPLPPKHATR